MRDLNTWILPASESHLCFKVFSKIRQSVVTHFFLIRNLGRAPVNCPSTEGFLAFGDLEYSKLLNSFLK